MMSAFATPVRSTMIGWIVAAGLALLVFAGALGAWAGGRYADAQAGKQITRLEGERDAAIARATTAEANAARLAQAKQRDDALTADLHAALRAARQLQRGLDDAIALTTSGSVCLHEPALRVLDGAAGLSVAGLPPAGGGAAGADAARIATDTDIGRWAKAAGEQYHECWARLEALINRNTATSAP